MKRLFDVALSGAALLVASPLLAIGALAIRATSPGPVLYRARRVGRNGRLFTMYKLRTMHVAPSAGAYVITARGDPRVFRVGALLRKSKIDELPQLLNILRGDMSIVGPRPEDPKIVDRDYTPAYRESLVVRPGLTSPGSVYYYTHGEHLLSPEDPERFYVERLLPIKMAIDVVYVRRASVRYDVAVIARTVLMLASSMLGRRRFPDPPEVPEARQLMNTWELSRAEPMTVPFAYVASDAVPVAR
jgi:lipopolysaccharide/colanic/teichoic acid biosynthesis glycosyltransferase